MIPASRTQRPNPYHAPRAKPRTRRWDSRRVVLWSLLLAPWVVYALVFTAARVLLGAGRPISDDARALVIFAGAGLANASVRTLFMYPSAWLLESLTERRLFSLEIMLVGWYPLATCGVLSANDYIPESHPVVQAVEFLPGAFTVLIVPLFIAWCVRAWRRLGRSQ